MNVNNVVKKGLCTSCGICKGVCPKGAIQFNNGKERNSPIVNNNICINCGICYQICPGKGIELNKLSKELFINEKGINKDDNIGLYLNTYIGYSTDYQIRYHSSSGGIVTQFLIYLFNKNIIDGAVLVKYNNDPFQPEPFLATTIQDVIKSRGSKYVVISMDNIIDKIINSNKNRIVVVGLPCHIQGFRNASKKNKIIKNKIIGYFSLYCSLNKTKNSLLYYPYRYNINTKDISEFSFRDDGCMGYMKFTDINGKVIKKIPYLDYWYGTHSFFTNSRCLLCIDQLGDLADISFGDIHIKPFSEDKIGINSIITRSKYWDELLKKCNEEKFIKIDDIPPFKLVSSQSYFLSFKRGIGVKTNFAIRSFFGKENPQYDYIFSSKISLKSIVAELLKYIMRKIGRNRRLWFIIKYIDRFKIR